MKKPIQKLIIAIPIILLTLITQFKIWGLYILILIFYSGYWLAKHKYQEKT
jgi:hypothetical protein